MSVREADEWWCGLPEKRRVEIYRWVEQPQKKDSAPGPGQLDLIQVMKTERKSS